MSVKRVRVAIDGPAGAGKSTVARGLAARLGYMLLDTGALYRTVALAATRAGLSLDDAEQVGSLAEALIARGGIAVERLDDAPPMSVPPGVDGLSSTRSGSGMRVRLDGEDVSQAIRAPEMSLGASRVSAHPLVRGALLAIQRKAGEQGGVVLEGRDIGTVVFPDAEVKFFLTASTDVRARRRFDELVARGQPVSLERTREEVESRDRADIERPIAPLRQAHDAVLVDSSERPVADLIEEMAALVLRAESA